MSDLRDQVVSAIQGNAVSPNDPQQGQLFQWNATSKRWEPTDSITTSGVNGATVTTDGSGDVTIKSPVNVTIEVVNTDVSISNNNVSLTANNGITPAVVAEIDITSTTNGSGNANVNIQASSSGSGVPTVTIEAVQSGVPTITSIIVQPNMVGLSTVPTQTTAPSAGAADPLPATPAGYLQVVINGNIQYIPYY